MQQDRAGIRQRKFHAVMTVVWIILVVPTLLFWSESILWVALMSVWANIAGHWSAWQASRAETNPSLTKEDVEEIRSLLCEKVAEDGQDS